MPQLIMLIGNIGSGKSTLAKQKYSSYTYISQDEQGKGEHKRLFIEALARGEDIIIDRQNHIKAQRTQYLDLAKKANYKTKIVWLKVNKALCERRVLLRQNHATISNKENVRGIINQHLSLLDPPTPDEVDEIEILETKFYAPIDDLTHLKGRIAVIGDVHGVYEELQSALDQIKPDHIVFAGDVVDRGPDIDKTLKLARQHYSVVGNHEDKLSRALIGNKVSISGGLDKTLEQISHFSEEEKKDLYNWIMTLPFIITLPKDYVVVHAGLEPSRPLHKQYCDTCLYIRTAGSKKMDDPTMPAWYKHSLHEDLQKRKILFGHNVHENISQVAPNIYALDKGAVYGTGLRIMVIDTEGEDQIMEFPTKEYCPKSSKGGNTHFFAEHEALVQAGYLSKSELDNLVLYNYTDKTVFDKKWNDITLNSRGTIYDKSSGRIVARAFPKFFNYGEHQSTHLENLPLHLPYKAFEKVDGSLGVLFKHKGSYRISTRGSFYSDQAKKATEMLSNYKLDELSKDITLLFEIIYPSNKIIVDYGEKEELVLLGAYNHLQGFELPWESVIDIATKCGFSTPKVYNHTLDELTEMAKSIPFQEEGWVIRFENELRVKVKGDDYLRIAKVKAHLTPLSIWESMVAGQIENYLIVIPEELRAEAEAVYTKLNAQLAVLRNLCNSSASQLKIEEVDPRDKAQRKAIAMQIVQAPKYMQGYLFGLISKTPQAQLDQTLLSYLRPTSNQYVELEHFLIVG